MDTANVTIGLSWTKISADDSSPIVAQFYSGGSYEVGVTSADSAPSGVHGHPVIGQNNAITRDLFASGYIWVRTVRGASVTFVVTQ